MRSLRELPLRALRAHPTRAFALFVFAALMASAVFGGTILVQGIRGGLATVEARLGADVLVTPSDAGGDFDARTFLLEAEPGYFYMDAGVVARVRDVAGVEKASPQIFLASARASCCSGRYQVIAFDPETDFAIQPWIADTTGGVEIGEMDVLVGANVAVPVDGSFKIYGRTLRVVGQFDPTGSTLDNAVYANFDTGRSLMAASLEKGLNKYRDADPGSVVSSVLVRVADGEDAEAVAQRIRESVDGVSVSTAKSMVSGISATLVRTSRAVALLVGVVWAVGSGMSVLVFTMMIHERAREFALLRAMGVSRSRLGRLVLAESAAVDLAGALAGVVVSGVLLSAFRALVGQMLGVGFLMPGPLESGLIALAALLVALASAGVAGWVSIRRIGAMDVGLVLREGE
ncbi:ABC transporter permease [Schaalia turicensis]|uniref:ABC transporter permease n=1 Tax=Schaalia turicensis TaxID=131111 RepID=UPI0018991F51|nr:ABC transporter permease [Schaalia turicensis]